MALVVACGHVSCRAVRLLRAQRAAAAGGGAAAASAVVPSIDARATPPRPSLPAAPPSPSRLTPSVGGEPAPRGRRCRGVHAAQTILCLVGCRVRWHWPRRARCCVLPAVLRLCVASGVHDATPRCPACATAPSPRAVLSLATARQLYEQQQQLMQPLALPQQSQQQPDRSGESGRDVVCRLLCCRPLSLRPPLVSCAHVQQRRCLCRQISRQVSPAGGCCDVT
jgi:hypothetical protein